MLQVHHWEGDLLDLATQALESGGSSHSQSVADREVLDQAYEHCAEITRENSKTFYMASGLIPGEKRKATRALYAFCRISDEIVDHPLPGTSDGTQVRTRLESWRQLATHEDQGGQALEIQGIQDLVQVSLPALPRMHARPVLGARAVGGADKVGQAGEDVAGLAHCPARKGGPCRPLPLRPSRQAPEHLAREMNGRRGNDPGLFPVVRLQQIHHVVDPVPHHSAGVRIF